MIKKYLEFLNESAQETSTVNGPAFSIRDTEIGSTIEVEGEPVKITEFTAWTKNKEASCITFRGELEDGTSVNVKYDDGVDGYVFYEPQNLPY